MSHVRIVDLNRRIKIIEIDATIKIYKATDTQTNKPKYGTESQRKVAIDKLLEMDRDYCDLIMKDNELSLQISRVYVEIEHYKRLYEIERIYWDTQ